MPVCQSASSRLYPRPDFINEALPGLFLFLLPCGVPHPQTQEAQHVHFVDFLHPSAGLKKRIRQGPVNHSAFRLPVSIWSFAGIQSSCSVASICFQKTVPEAIFLIADHGSQINVSHAVEDIGFNGRVIFFQLCDQLFRLKTFG